eukprot:m.3934 g.3934  ORF g.3934 m.3934 type:complete len:888 (+) comp2852_c0_seq2:147-2810(+)
MVKRNHVVLLCTATLISLAPIQAQPEGIQLMGIDHDYSKTQNRIYAVNVQGLYPGETVAVTSELLKEKQFINNSYLPSSSHIHSDLGSLLIHTGQQINRHIVADGSLDDEISLTQKYQELWNVEEENYVGMTYDKSAGANKLWRITNAGAPTLRATIDFSPNIGYLSEGSFVDSSNNHMFILASGGNSAQRYLVYDYSMTSDTPVKSLTMSIVSLKAWFESSSNAIALSRDLVLYRVSLSNGGATQLKQLSFGQGFHVSTVSSFLDAYGYLFLMYSNTTMDNYLVYDVNSNTEYENFALGMKRQVYYIVNVQHTTTTTVSTTTLTQTTKTTVTITQTVTSVTTETSVTETITFTSSTLTTATSSTVSSTSSTLTTSSVTSTSSTLSSVTSSSTLSTLTSSTITTSSVSSTTTSTISTSTKSSSSTTSSRTSTTSSRTSSSLSSSTTTISTLTSSTSTVSSLTSSSSTSSSSSMTVSTLTSSTSTLSTLTSSTSSISTLSSSTSSVTLTTVTSDSITSDIFKVSPDPTDFPTFPSGPTTDPDLYSTTATTSSTTTTDANVDGAAGSNDDGNDGTVGIAVGSTLGILLLCCLLLLVPIFVRRNSKRPVEGMVESDEISAVGDRNLDMASLPEGVGALSQKQSSGGDHQDESDWNVAVDVLETLANEGTPREEEMETPSPAKSPAEEFLETPGPTGFQTLKSFTPLAPDTQWLGRNDSVISRVSMFDRKDSRRGGPPLVMQDEIIEEESENRRKSSHFYPEGHTISDNNASVLPSEETSADTFSPQAKEKVNGTEEVPLSSSENQTTNQGEYLDTLSGTEGVGVEEAPVVVVETPVIEEPPVAVEEIDSEKSKEAESQDRSSEGSIRFVRGHSKRRKSTEGTGVMQKVIV